MKCLQCGAASPQGKAFCGDCGAALNSTEARQLAEGNELYESVPTKSAPTGAERRPLTVAFCDLAGSTRLSAELDPEDLREVIAAYQRCVADTVAHHGGFIAKYMGCGVLLRIWLGRRMLRQVGFGSHQMPGTSRHRTRAA